MKQLTLAMLLFMGLAFQTATAQLSETRLDRLISEVKSERTDSQEIEKIISIVNQLKREQHIIVVSNSDYQQFHMPMEKELEEKANTDTSKKAFWLEELETLRRQEISYDQFKSKYLKR